MRQHQVNDAQDDEKYQISTSNKNDTQNASGANKKKYQNGSFSQTSISNLEKHQPIDKRHETKDLVKETQNIMVSEEKEDKKVSNLFPPQNYICNIGSINVEIQKEIHNSYEKNKANKIIEKMKDPNYMFHLELKSNMTLDEICSQDINSKILKNCLQKKVLSNKKAKICFFDLRHVIYSTYQISTLYEKKQLTRKDNKKIYIPKLYWIDKYELYDIKSKMLQISNNVLKIYTDKDLLSDSKYSKLEKCILSVIYDKYKKAVGDLESYYDLLKTIPNYENLNNIYQLLLYNKNDNNYHDYKSYAKSFALNFRSAMNQLANYYLFKNIFDEHKKSPNYSHLIHIGCNHDIEDSIEEGLVKCKLKQ